MASQMKDAVGVRTQVRIEAPTADQGVAAFATSGKVITFAGFLRAYVAGSDDPEAELADQEKILPALVARRGPRRGGARALRPHDPTTGALHRGQSGQRARGPRHRPSFDLRLDHSDYSGPRLCVEQGPGAGADLYRVRRHPAARTQPPRPGGLRLHRPDGGRARRHRPRRKRGGALAARFLLRRRRRRQRPAPDHADGSPRAGGDGREHRAPRSVAYHDRPDTRGRTGGGAGRSLRPLHPDRRIRGAGVGPRRHAAG